MTIARTQWLNVAAVTAIGCYAGAFALISNRTARLGLIAPLIALPFIWWLISGAQRWVAALLAAVTLLPPLPIALGDSGPHPALLIALAGMFIAVARAYEWKLSFDSVTCTLLALLCTLLISAGFAAIYSGVLVAASTLARIALFGISVFVFVYVAHGPDLAERWLTPALRCLLLMAAIGATFACIDFYYQFPPPAGYSQQFVWLSSGVIRRAQGLYYEASTLGNFCAFFLVMIAVGLTQARNFRPVNRMLLLSAGVVLAAALVFSYSRASLLNVVVAGVTLAVVKRVRMKRMLVALGAGAVIVVLILAVAFPTFAASYWTRLSLSVEYFWSSPEGVLSGRVASWRTLVDFLTANPWHAFFGIGYKTLPYSEFAGKPVIADNMYLSLLIETGLPGLFALLAFSYSVIRAGYRASRSVDPKTTFLGLWILCFWMGQLVQMLSGDLLTYWRVLPVYFWVLAMVVRRNREGAPA